MQFDAGNLGVQCLLDLQKVIGGAHLTGTPKGFQELDMLLQADASLGYPKRPGIGNKLVAFTRAVESGLQISVNLMSFLFRL